jgi:hypothetical protein
MWTFAWPSSQLHYQLDDPARRGRGHAIRRYELGDCEGRTW